MEKISQVMSLITNCCIKKVMRAQKYPRHLRRDRRRPRRVNLKNFKLLKITKWLKFCWNNQTLKKMQRFAKTSLFLKFQSQRVMFNIQSWMNRWLFNSDRRWSSMLASLHTRTRFCKGTLQQPWWLHGSVTPPLAPLIPSRRQTFLMAMG